MLVTFSCSVYPNITFFGDIAKQLLQRLGHSGTIPGALMADEVPAALKQLEENLKKPFFSSPKTALPGEEDEDKITLQHRAFPLLQMLEAAAKHHVNIMWE